MIKNSSWYKNIYLKTAIIILGGLLIPAILMGILEFKNLEKELTDKVEGHIAESLDVLSVGLKRAVWEYSPMNVESVIKSSNHDSDVVRVMVFDSQQTVFYEKTFPDFANGKIEELRTRFKEKNIYHNDKLIGKIKIEYTFFNVHKTLKSYLVSFIFLRLFQLSVALTFTLVFLHYGLLKRINRLATEAQDIGDGRLDNQFCWEKGDPIDNLGVNLEYARDQINMLFKEVKSKNDELIFLNQDLENQVKLKTQQLIHSTKMTALGEMAAGVAHEINNPLTVISAQTKSMAKKVAKGEMAADEIVTGLEKVTRMGVRIEKIVRGLRAFSGNTEKDKKVINKLANIFDETMDLCQAKLKGHNVELFISEIPDISLECRSVEISQVILNLINNAADAIKDLKEKWVRVEISSVDDVYFSIRVTDSGTGIPSDVASKMMQPFFTTKEVDKGTGLGLSISIGIIKDHRGRLWLDEKAKNTSFVIELPYYKSIGITSDLISAA